MFLNAAESLSWLAARVPRGLVEESTLTRLPGLARGVGPCAGISLELHVERAGLCRRADVVIALRPRWGGLQLARAAQPDDSARWRATRDFCATWTRELHGDSLGVPVLGVEFDDTSPQREATSEPYPTACVQPDFYRGAVDRGHGERGEAVCDRLWRVLALLDPGGAHRTPREPVRQCIESLPPAAALVHVAPGRAGSGVRLVVAVPRALARRYLDDIGWPGSRGLLDEILEMAAFGAYAELYLEVDDAVGAVLGSGSPSFGPPDLDLAARTLDAMAALGLSERASLANAERWIGEEIACLPGARWPSRVWYALCAKVTLGASGRLAGKIYLEAYPKLDLSTGLLADAPTRSSGRADESSV